MNFVSCPLCKEKTHQRCLHSHTAKYCITPAIPHTAHNIMAAQLLPIPNFEPEVSLPENWKDLTSDEKMDKLMMVTLETSLRSKNIATYLTDLTVRINDHAALLSTHQQDIKNITQNVDKLTNDFNDIQTASIDRALSPNLYLSGVPKDLKLSNAQILDNLLQFASIDVELYKFNILEVRQVNFKNPHDTDAYVIECISPTVASKFLQSVSKARKAHQMTAKSVFDHTLDTVLYLNKMLPTYYHNLAYQARQMKKQKGWKAVWVHEDNIYVKLRENTLPIIVTSLAHLNSLE